jgi:hypothetical protein
VRLEFMPLPPKVFTPQTIFANVAAEGVMMKEIKLRKIEYKITYQQLLTVSARREDIIHSMLVLRHQCSYWQSLMALQEQESKYAFHFGVHIFFKCVLFSFCVGLPNGP